MKPFASNQGPMCVFGIEPRPRARAAAWKIILLTAASLLAMSVPARSQESVPARLEASHRPAGSPVPATLTPPPAATDIGALQLLVGRSTLIDVPSPITRVSLTIPEVADAMVTAPQQLLVHGKTPGTISLFVWDRAGMVRTYNVVVQRDLSELETRLRQLFPGEPIAVASSGKDIVLSGIVSSRYVVDKGAEVAAGYVESKDHVVNLLRQEDTLSQTQVLLRVRFAEVSRSSLQELGASLFSDGYKDYLGRSTTQQFPGPSFDQRVPLVGEHMVFSDYLNLFLFDAASELGAVVKALQTRGLFQSLAEPNLIAQNGKEASFLAGGEYPYPAVQGGANNLAITVLFKEFGIRLSFLPTVLRDDVIHLKVRPEVSALDFTNAVSVQGFRVPSLSTRRAETELELRDGQTFAIAGLLNNTLTESMQKIPGLGDIPLLGLLFKSRALQKADTELVVMITPQIMRTGSAGVSTTLPALDKEFLPRQRNQIPAPPAWNPSGMPPPARQDGAADGQAQAPDSPAAAPSPAQVREDVAGTSRRVAEEAKAREEEAKRTAEAERAEAKRAAEAERAARREAEEARKREEKAAREQAERERKEAAEAAKVAAREAEEARKRDEKAAREQLERERKAREAEAKAKQAAEAAQAAEREAEALRRQNEEAQRRRDLEDEKKRAEEEQKAREEAERKEDGGRERKTQAREAEPKRASLSPAELKRLDAALREWEAEDAKRAQAKVEPARAPSKADETLAQHQVSRPQD